MTSEQPSAALRGAQDPMDLTLPLYGATPKQAVIRFFKNYATFTGRASRSEYWWVSAALAVAMLPGYVLYVTGLLAMTDSSGLNTGNGGGLFAVGVIWVLLIGLACLVPSLAVVWRRLHDAGFSGLLYLLSLIPYLGSLVVLVLTVLPSKPEGVKYDVVKS